MRLERSLRCYDGQLTLGEMYGENRTVRRRTEPCRLSVSTSRVVGSEMLKDGEVGLQPGFELPWEDTEEQEPERGRGVVMWGGVGLASLSRPREAISSMKDGRAPAISWAEMETGMCREGGLEGGRVEGGHSYMRGRTPWRRPTVVMCELSSNPRA